MHFYAWKSGLKTGMYYLRTKSAVDAIKFTLDNKKKQQPTEAVTEVVAAPQDATDIVVIRNTKAVILGVYVQLLLPCL